jgi:hypothetical protein
MDCAFVGSMCKIKNAAQLKCDYSLSLDIILCEKNIQSSVVSYGH